MAVLPSRSSCLDLTISTPAFTPSPALPSSSEGGRGAVMMRDLDINQVPSGEEDYCMELDEDESNINVHANVNVNGPPRKKLRLTKEQSRLLEQSFRNNHTLNPKEKEVLALELKLKPRQVEVWFQNRRARSKLKQTEMECEYLKRWFGSLTEQNRRLQREVEELRAMKVGAGHGGEALQRASMLTMCPRCERVSTASLDKGPTRTTIATTATNINTNTTTILSSKVPVLHSRHPSAAC